MTSTAPSGRIEREATRAVLDLSIRCGEVIFASGASAEDATATMLAVTDAYGLRDCQADVTHTMITLSHENGVDGEVMSRSRNVKYRTLDYTKLTNVSTLIGELLRSPIEVRQARARVDAITAAKPSYPVIAQHLGWGLVGGGAALLLGGGPLVIVAAIVATFVIDLLTSALTRTKISVFYQTLAGGAVGPLVAAAVHAIDPNANSSLVVVAAIIMLLAGVTSFGAVQDVLSGFYVTGAARMLEAMLITGGLVAGVAGASMLIARFGLHLDIEAYVPPTLSNLPVLLAAVVIIIVGFSLAVDVPPRALIAVNALGLASFLVYTWALSAEVGVGWSAGLAALLIGMLSALASRLVRTPALPLVVPALVPLVPGLLLFRGLLELSAGDFRGVLSILEAAAVAVALAAGALLGQYLVQNVLGPARRIQRRFVGPLMGLQIGLGRAKSDKKI